MDKKYLPFTYLRMTTTSRHMNLCNSILLHFVYVSDDDCIFKWWNDNVCIDTQFEAHWNVPLKERRTPKTFNIFDKGIHIYDNTNVYIFYVFLC